ncbi:MAG: DUF370 domain-containing protein [Clostridia bacterium]|nr:DUF370 domain-containing protein [Clostridia bacterium]
MYLHLGQEVVVKEEEVVGIFDLDTSTVSKHTRKFLNIEEKEKRVINVSYELPKSFIVCSKGKKDKKVYISQISSVTLNKRSSLERKD